MQADNEFLGTETGSEVPGVDGAAANHVVPDLSAQPAESVHVEPLDVGRGVDMV
jgi:hypothetical protein